MERHFLIRVRGRLGEGFGRLFGLAIEPHSDQTLLTGRMVDQAHLDGVLAYLRGLGIELVSVETEAGGELSGNIERESG